MSLQVESQIKQKETITAAPKSMLWEQFKRLAEKAFQQGTYAEAQTNWEKALKEAELMGSMPRLITSLRNLGQVLETRGKYAEAELIARRALILSEKSAQQDQSQLAESLELLAGIYMEQERLANAEELYRRALAIREKSRPSDQTLIATDLNNLALVLSRQLKYDLAETLYKRALAIDEKTLGPEHPDVASELNNLGATYMHLGKDFEAKTLLEKALSLQEKTLGPNHPNLAFTLTNLGMVQQAQGLYGLAENSYQRALNIRESALGTNHPLLLPTLDHMAALMRATKRNTEAAKFEARARLVRSSQQLGQETPQKLGSNVGQRSVADNKNTLWDKYDAAGTLSYESGNYSEAIDNHKLALQEAEKLTEQDPKLLVSLRKLAKAYHEQRSYPAAEPLFKRIIELKKAKGRNGDLAIAYEELAQCYFSQSKRPEAYATYKEALAIRERDSNSSDLQLEPILSKMGMIASISKLNDDAEAIYKRLMAIANKRNDQYKYGMYMLSLGMIYHQQGKEELFSETTSKASQIIREAPGHKSQETERHEAQMKKYREHFRQEMQRHFPNFHD